MVPPFGAQIVCGDCFLLQWFYLYDYNFLLYNLMLDALVDRIAIQVTKSINWFINVTLFSFTKYRNVIGLTGEYPPITSEMNIALNKLISMSMSIFSVLFIFLFVIGGHFRINYGFTLPFLCILFIL